MKCISPGGNGAGMNDEFLDQQSNQHFAVKPSPGALGIIFGKMAQLGNLFEALENQFDLPAQAIPIQDLPGAEFSFSYGGENQDISSIKQCISLQGDPLFIGLLSQLFAGAFGGLPAFSNHAKATRHQGAISEADARWPLSNFPGAGDALERLNPFEWLTFWLQDSDGSGIESQDHIGSLADYLMDASGT